MFIEAGKFRRIIDCSQISASVSEDSIREEGASQ